MVYELFRTENAAAESDLKHVAGFDAENYGKFVRDYFLNGFQNNLHCFLRIDAGGWFIYQHGWQVLTLFFVYAIA
jgi:hypothetical protein